MRSVSPVATQEYYRSPRRPQMSIIIKVADFLLPGEYFFTMLTHWSSIAGLLADLDFMRGSGPEFWLTGYKTRNEKFLLTPTRVFG